VAAALENADGAWVASGTAVLETALLGVPAVAIYVIPPGADLVRSSHDQTSLHYASQPRLRSGGSPGVASRSREPARAGGGARRADKRPAQQYQAFREFRQALGPADALERCARYAVELARAHGSHTDDSHLSHLRSARPARFRRRLRALRERRPVCSSIAATRCAAAKRSITATSRSLLSSDEAATMRKASEIASFIICSRRLRARASRMRHPLVCTNLRDTKGRPLPFLQALRLPAFDSKGSPICVNVLGVLIMQYPEQSFWERVFGWRFLNPWEAIAPFAAAVAEEEPLVVLSHFGTLSRLRAGRCEFRASICCLAVTATIRFRPRVTLERFRSFMRARTESSYRAAS